MCGIGGIILLARKRTEQELRKIRALATKLLVELEKRGSDSAGMAVINKDYIWTLKQPARATEFVKTQMFHTMLNRASEHTKGILLHTRAATQGSRENNNNNHPIIAGDIIGIHNGILYNDDEIFENFQEHFARKGEVDSEAIFRLIDYYMKHGASGIKNIRKALKKLQGSMAIAFVDRFDTGSFYLYTNSKTTPISVAYLHDLGAFVFASRKEYLKNSIPRYSRGKRNCRYYLLRENDLLKLTVEKAELEMHKARTKPFDYRSYGWGFGYLSDYRFTLANEGSNPEKMARAVSDGKERQAHLLGTFC